MRKVLAVLLLCLTILQPPLALAATDPAFQGGQVSSDQQQAPEQSSDQPPAGDQQSDTGDQPQKKETIRPNETDANGKVTTTKLKLRGEAGDEEIVINWYAPEPGDTPVDTYTISYHSERDKVERRLEKIKGNNYRLRGLKNGIVHYVRVSGYSKEGKEVASSEEITVTPLPPEDSSSAIERSFSRGLKAMTRKVDGKEVKLALTQFGYDFFTNAGAASRDNLPVGSDYVIGPGDSLRLDIWGTTQGRYDLEVDRNGEITIPRIGAVKVWGLTYAQLRGVVDKSISRYFKGYEFNITLGKLRTIQIFVVGEVQAPGAYTVSSLSSAINALSAAGGPTKSGSLRQVRLVRGGKTVQDIDLYSMFLSGDRSRDVRVENGDTLFVPVIGPVAAVAGEVKRPGIYELKGPATLSSVIEMAGGISASGDKGRIQVERLEGNSSRVIHDYLPKGGQLEQELASIPISDHDMVKVFPFYDVARQVVTLSGNVSRPGEYQYRKGMRLRDLLPGYDAILPDTYLGSAEITRQVLPDRHLEKLSANLGKALSGDAKENIELRDQDEVKVFSLWQMQERPMVSITGEVKKAGNYPFYPRMTVRDLLAAAGSLKRNALMEDAELTRIDISRGSATPTRINLDLKKALAGDPSANLELQPDDVLIVRSITQWLEMTDRFITLKGEVRYPGKYSITKGERLSSVIERAGGFTDRAYLRGARFTRKSVQVLQQKRMDEVIARSEQDILRKQSELSAVSSSSEDLAANKAALDSLMKSLETLKLKKAEGRIVISLLPPEKLAKSKFDLELMGGDILDVPATPSVVSVMGQVYSPATFVFSDDGTVSKYLSSSGGPLNDADTSEMYVLRADGTVLSRSQSSFGFSWDESDKTWHFGSFLSRTLWPGDTVVVPQKLDRIAWLREIKDITTIVSQVALTAGTIWLFFK
ncbi:SLBB domain-containing protein [Geomonas sp. Red32]|uniref:SLBB domain-containing protein n=1 Tax=Geomonas sp. Red32 TaxID=2912856 RepID=UPI00202CD907|nr:SLBB domain-containing protein [Geomonas sp. Red32]MCM0082319.1 SLBB domain-containing protein [Geomonas sp. Red32]